MRRRHAKQAEDLRLEEIETARKARDWHTVWKVTSLVARTGVAPKKRHYGETRRFNPSVAEWTQFLALPPHEGGLAARSFSEDSLPVHDGFRCVERVSVERSLDDWDTMRRLLAMAPMRRAFPPWSSAAEIWRQLWLPTTSVAKRTLPIGAHEPRLSAPTFKRMMISLFASIRRHGRMPQVANRSQGFNLDKHNNKVSCGGLRTIHIMCVVWRKFVQGYRVNHVESFLCIINTVSRKGNVGRGRC